MVTAGDEESLLRPRDVAAKLGMSTTYVYWLIRRGSIPAVKVSPRTIRIRPEDFRAFLAKRRAHEIFYGKLE